MSWAKPSVREIKEPERRAGSVIGVQQRARRFLSAAADARGGAGPLGADAVHAHLEIGPLVASACVRPATAALKALWRDYRARPQA